MRAIIAFIIIFGVLVIVHEFGHYYAAKKSGILVREFSIGMGPKLLAFHKNGTTYTLRLLPIGGYVRMAGLEDDDSEIRPGTTALLSLDEQTGKVSEINLSKQANNVNGIPVEIDKADLVHNLYIDGYVNGDEEQLQHYQVDHDAMIVEADGTAIQIAPLDVQYQSVSIWKRIIVNFAGPFNNFVLAIFAFALSISLSGGVPQMQSNQIGQVIANKPAAQAGLKAGDRILKVNQQRTHNFVDLTAAINAHPKQAVKLQVENTKHQTKQITVTPAQMTQNGKATGVIGITPVLKNNFWSNMTAAFSTFGSTVAQIFHVLGSFFTGGFSLNKLAGPVGIYTMTSQAVKLGLPVLVGFTASLSLNLGIMNLIPIPALDGGKILLNIIEAIRHKPLPPEKEGILTMIGFGILLILMILVTGNDIMRYFR
ncbi:MAG: RIP metalloprotease RseP [Candidatus Paralactobacillus gallistercoris]|uniref:Zinc metalloprotease n=1 Tax=Candidatus Paralactobacillus gallistercoris TaxID=2838724 RepID=A0A948TIW3_9LACO|nr:RIP metalloprotease RseP [Candidatus Paralactobacillus gallistercoris]